MVELLKKGGSTRTITQEAICDTRQQVIDWYGLNEPDIISYSIEIEEMTGE